MAKWSETANTQNIFTNDEKINGNLSITKTTQQKQSLKAPKWSLKRQYDPKTLRKIKLLKLNFKTGRNWKKLKRYGKIQKNLWNTPNYLDQKLNIKTKAVGTPKNNKKDKIDQKANIFLKTSTRYGYRNAIMPCEFKHKDNKNRRFSSHCFDKDGQFWKGSIVIALRIRQLVAEWLDGRKLTEEANRIECFRLHLPKNFKSFKILTNPPFSQSSSTVSWRKSVSQ